MRSRGLALAAVVLLVTACGGGGHSPTDPAPTPTPPTGPVSLEGSWSGPVTITSPTSITCTLSLTLSRDGVDYFGDWEAQCSDGKQGRGLAFANIVFANQVLVAGLQGQPVFGGCGWASLATREGSRLQGDWSTPQNCQAGPFLQGRMTLTKR
jgi:hypothetical protein